MADFEPAFQKMLKDEGGLVLHNVPGDRGGMTYAGIARNANPGWEGWDSIDHGDIPSTELVRRFYREHYWREIRGDVLPQKIADTIFNFAVNAGPVTAVKLAQLVVGATPDGLLGPKSVSALEAYDPDKFVMAYALAKVARYRDIVQRDRTQQKFLLGWINRTLAGLV